MRTHEIVLNGQRYAFRDGGRGTPLLLLHGFTGSGASWRDLLDRLSDRYRLIAPDLLGHGGSAAPADPARYIMERAAADLTALLDRLEVERAHLLGYSMGGRLALYLAIHAPERWRSVILESASPGLADPAQRAARRARDERLAADIEREGIESFVARWERLPLWETQTAAQKAALREGRLANRPVGLANSLRGMGTGVQPSLWHRLARVERPVMLVVGEGDGKFLRIGRQMATQLPEATLKIVPGAGHTIHVETPTLFAGFIAQWLDGHQGQVCTSQ